MAGLTPTVDGLVCPEPGCDYVQTWAPDFFFYQPPTTTQENNT